VELFLNGLPRPVTIVEPFAGTAVTSLTLLNRGFCQRVVLAEKDAELREFWIAALTDPSFADRVFKWMREAWALSVKKQVEFVAKSLIQMEKDDPPFHTLLRSHLGFNGILKGRDFVGSVRPVHEWLPETLDTSLEFLYEARHNIEVLSDGFDALERTNHPDNFAFVDPPYTSGRHSPGHQLYRESDIDHELLLRVLAKWGGPWLLTAEYCPAMRTLLARMAPVLGPIQIDIQGTQNGRGRKKVELVVSRRSGGDEYATSGMEVAGKSPDSLTPENIVTGANLEPGEAKIEVQSEGDGSEAGCR
jgi:site-specific DNA-adenine methylase